MATSSHETFGIIDTKQINIKTSVVAHAQLGGTTTLSFANTAASNTLTIPATTSSATILTSESVIDAQKVAHEDLTALTTIDSLDEIPFVDISDTDAKKKITFQNFVNSVESNINGSASSGQIRVADAGGDYQNRAMIGDATISLLGAVSLSDKPSAKAIVEANKFLQADALKNINSINALGCATLTASGNVAGADISASGDLSCVDAVCSGDLGCVDVVCSGDASAVNTTSSGEFRLGTNKWKMAQNGNNLQFLEYNGTAWVSKFEIQGVGQA
jgi:hypothetical protein